MFKGFSAAAFAIAVLGLLAAAGSVRASDPMGNFALRGIGAQTCQSMTKQIAATPASANELASWIGGYVSAINRFQPGTFDASPVLDPRVLASMVAQICKENPKAMVESATYDLFRAMGPARLKGDSPIITAKSGNHATALRRDTLYAVQAALVKGGYLQKKPDGVFDPATETALRTFQGRQKLNVTGLPDPPTVLRILVAPLAK